MAARKKAAAAPPAADPDPPVAPGIGARTWEQPNRQCLGLDPVDASLEPDPPDPPVPPDPAPLDVVILIGLDGDGNATVGGGPSDGVRIEAQRDGTALDWADVASVDWGDGTVDTPPNSDGGYVAHRYQTAATGVAISVTAGDGGTGTSTTFDVVEATPPPEDGS